jgi:hypothetical protein
VHSDDPAEPVHVYWQPLPHGVLLDGPGLSSVGGQKGAIVDDEPAPHDTIDEPSPGLVSSHIAFCEKKKSLLRLSDEKKKKKKKKTENRSKEKNKVACFFNLQNHI